MKIGFVSNLYPPNVRGGAEHVVVRTVEALTENGQDVFVVSTHPRNNGKDTQIDNRPTERIYRFFPKNFYYLLNDNKFPWVVRFLWHVRDAFSRHGARQVSRIMTQEEPDVMVTHNLKGIGLRIPQAIRSRGVPHVHVVHDLQLIYPSGLLFAGKEKISRFVKPFYALYRRICKKRIGDPDLVIFPSEYLKEEYLKNGFFRESEVIVMPNPAPRFTGVDMESRNPGPLRLLFVGQLERHKGIKFLIEALDKMDKDTQLIIAGEGTETDFVKKQAQADKRIVYLGYVAVDQLVKCFGLADALVVPSLCYENSPTVIYESLQAGVPVLASEIGGVGELVEDGKNGFLFTPGNMDDFLDVVSTLHQHKDRFTPEKLRKSVEPYALETYGRDFLKLLRRIV